MDDMKTKLAEANEKVTTQRTERARKNVKGSHLVEKFLTQAKDAGLTVRENTSFYVLSGPAGKAKRIALAKRGGLIDLVSFSVQSPAVTQVTRDEAKAKHLGRVEGRITFEVDDAVTAAAFTDAVGVLNVPEPVKAVKPKKEKTDALAATTQSTETSAQV